jgi:hypothetical protein
MYHLVLVNLTPDARAVSPLAYLELRDARPEVLKGLLDNFCEIDPIANAAGDTEIRVNVRHEKYLLRTEQKKVILYDVNQRDLPGQLLTVAQAMVELDGSAAVARQEAVRQARALTAPPFAMTAAAPVVVAPAPAASKPRLISLSAALVALLVAIGWLIAPLGPEDNTPENFVPVGADETGPLQASLTGVYLTGSEPGRHGIVVTGPGELKLFELAAVEAPRVVYAAYRLGRIDGKLHLATDQPGGAIEVAAGGGLRYGGETYLRLP